MTMSFDLSCPPSLAEPGQGSSSKAVISSTPPSLVKRCPLPLKKANDPSACVFLLESCEPFPKLMSK
jgi:hypothetical protein